MDNDIAWKSRIRAAFETEKCLPDDDVLEELAGHAQAMYAAARASGCTDDEAGSRVDRQIEFWRSNAGALRRSSRRRPAVQPPPAFTPSIFSGLGQDISYAARRLRREPRYALLAIVTMALAIGATTALFSVTYGVLMKPLPWPNADRLVVLKETRGGQRCLPIYIWNFPKSFDAAHTTEIILVFDIDGQASVRSYPISYYPFRFEHLEERLKSAGFPKLQTDYNPNEAEYRVTAS